MAKVVCPKCRRDVAPEDVNVGTDTAYCRSCEEAFRLSGSLPGSERPEKRRVDPSDPPPGAWFEETFDGFRVGATTRTWFAVFIVPFTVVWAGFAFSFFFGSLAAGSGLALFATPFFIAGLFLVSFCALSVAGKTEVSVDRERGRVFTGVGAIGWSRTFDWDAIDRVREDQIHYSMRGPMVPGLAISLEGRRRIRFGMMLSVDRGYFVAQTLKAKLAERG